MSTGVLKICVLAVSLKLKFKCRMRVEWKDGVSTQETAISDGLFKFDEVLSLSLQQAAAQLNVALITEKGSFYSGGKVRLHTSELKHSIGQIVRLPILKCIDNQAWMQTKILGISQNQGENNNRKDISFTQKRPFQIEIQTPEKNVRENFVIQDNNGQTKSEYGFHLPLNSPPFQFEKNKIRTNTKRGFVGQYSIQRSSRQPRDPSPQRSTRRDSPQQYRQEADQARRLADYSASKLKSVQLKYKQEQEKGNQERQKRKQLQDAEQGYKMQIIRLKLNKQENERQLAKKAQTIKELTAINNTLKDADKKVSMFKQQLRKKKQEVNFLSEQIRNQNQQLTDIKKSAQYQINRSILQFNQLKKENENLRNNQNTSIEELKMVIYQKEEEINCADLKRSSLEQDLQEYKKSKTQLELKTRQQITQLEKSVNLLKKQLKNMGEQLVATKDTSQKQKLELTQMMATHRQQIAKERINSTKIQLQKKGLQEQLSETEQKLREIKKYKEMYQQRIEQDKSTKEEYLWTKRKFAVAVEENHKLEERLKICLQQNQIYIQQINNFIDKQRICDDKLNEYHQELQQNRVLVEKHKRNQENHQKDSLSNQQKQRQFKNQLNKKQMEINRLHSEIESLNVKLAQMKETIKFETSKKTNKAHNSIEQQWEDSKLNTILQNQRFLEMEIMNHKQNYAEIQVQYAKAREELQKCGKNEMDWREQERMWQSQKQKYFSENNKLMKEIKESTKKLDEADAVMFGLTQKLQKQRKISKQQEQKIAALQISIKKINQQKEHLTASYNQQVQNCRALSNEILVVKKQNQCMENEKERIYKISESLSMENKKMKQEIFLISKRSKDQHDKYLSEAKKIKEELNKSEARTLNFKKQADKFKQNLRNILVDSIISKIPRNEQEYELVLKKKEEKLGLTLTNELLIRLEDYLKELHRHQLQLESKLHSVEKELMNSREETIMKTNQFQNSELQLKDKMEELLQNLQRIRQIYENREKELKKEIDRYEWQNGNKNQEIKKLKQVQTSRSEQVKSLKQHLQNRQTHEITLNGEILKLKTKLKETEQEYLSLLDQYAALEQHSSNLQAAISNHTTQIQQSCAQKQRLLKNIQELESGKQSLSELQTQKKSLKAIIFSLQSETQELKILHSHCQQQIQSYCKQKNDLSSLMKTVMKEKQNLLRQYLESEQKISLLENKEFEMNEKISELSEGIQKMRKDNQEDKKSLNYWQGQTKAAELAIQQKQSFLKQTEQKYKNLERNKNTLEQTMQKIQMDCNRQKDQRQLFIKSKDIQITQIKDQLASKNMKLQQLQTKLIKEQKRYQQLHQQTTRLKHNMASLNQQRGQNEQRLTEYIQKETQVDIELFSYKTEITKLQEELNKVEDELKERDLKNYQLSSQIYRLQTESSNQIERLAQKITDQQISMAKYEQTCEQYSNRIVLIEKDNQLLTKAKEQIETEYTKLKTNHNSLSIQCSSIQQKRAIIQTELQKVKDTYKKLAIIRDHQQRQNQQEIAKFQDNLRQRQLQLQKMKQKNETTKQLLEATNQKIIQKQRQLNEEMKKSAVHQQTSKKMQLQLRKAKQNWKQLHWNSQREVKKIIHSKVLFLNNIQPHQDSPKLGDHLKGLQESILDVIKKYADS